MGGYGSGRRSGKTTVETCRALDVNKLQRAGQLEAGAAGQWVWRCDDAEIARIAFFVEAGRITLEYRWQDSCTNWVPVTEAINLTYVDCSFGGVRPYFECPGVVNSSPCRRRVGKLFAAGRYFLCRHCYRLGYESQCEAPQDRLLRRANKLRMTLGGPLGAMYGIPARPKGMWQRTYLRTASEIERCERQADLIYLSKYHYALSPQERERLLDG